MAELLDYIFLNEQSTIMIEYIWIFFEIIYLVTWKKFH